MFIAQRRSTEEDQEFPGLVEEMGRCDYSDVYWSPPTSEVELYSIFQNKKFGMIPGKEVRSV